MIKMIRTCELSQKDWGSVVMICVILARTLLHLRQGVVEAGVQTFRTMEVFARDTQYSIASSSIQVVFVEYVKVYHG